MAALKIDMNKAYDRVNWRFLLKVLQAYDLPGQWIKLISQCISTVTYRILINGQITEAFPSTCGLRQGDPLSPYLFLFCMDILSRMLTLATDLRHFDGFRAHRYAPSISHLFFADDALLFFKASTTSCTAISNLLGRFCHISGQMINLRKSYVKFSPNIPENRVLEYKGLLQLDSTKSLGTYLGAPVDIQGKKTQHFTFLLDNITQRITSWSHLPLSQAAKLILINSILLASIAHILSVFLIPRTIANKVDAMLTRFFWSTNSGKGIAWRSKDILHLPKGAGGLGLRSITLHNRSLLIKKVWRLHRNPNLLISKIFCSIPRANAITLTKLRPLRGQCSWGARGLHQAEKVLLTNYVWKIGSNSGLLAGKERWVNGAIPLFREDVPLRTVALTTVASLLLPQHQGWNVPRLCELFQSSTVRTIRGLEIPRFNSPSNSLLWPFTTSGQYTTKSGYFFLSRNTYICSMNVPLNLNFFRISWGLRIMPKWKIFLWKLCHNGIATSANLSSRGLAISDTCPQCNMAPETSQHIFRSCHLATILWQSGQLGIHSNSNPDVAFQDWLIAWVHYFYQHDGYHGARLPIFVATLWGIWQGIAWVVDHISSHTREGQGSCIIAPSALSAEAKACLEALIWAQGHGLRHIMVYTDCELLVQGLRHQGTQPISIAWTLDDIRSIGQQFQWCRITKVSRLLVQQAHDLATHIRKGQIPFTAF
ncbi:uncharacterized protein LOC104889595 [Beta vulgaris subsp. vulgaris]|uniref:uncharacterized protein LOC104889595 n=1 Tax=Beta vulgaris subsp. vulgaris TaxID=3555 RepID=UPI00053F4040|nr:uncharacterized protein LOC104889595 [Beta vulgaris subsp. vulgaris]